VIGGKSLNLSWNILIFTRQHWNLSLVTCKFQRLNYLAKLPVSIKAQLKVTVRPMKIDIMFLVPARMGFICRTKIFHYSLFLKNRLNKTPNWSPDQSLIAAFRKRKSNCIFLKILLARVPLFFMSALVCVEIYCSVGRIKLKWIIHRFTSDFYWVKEIYWQAEFKYKK
jgi:hypothetical protein